MKVKKMLLREETEKVLHTKSNGDKLVVAASGDGYTAFTKDDVHIGHISAETDAAAIAEFSKKEPQYEALDMSQDELRITAERYLDFEIGELMTELLEKTSTMSREQLSRLVRLCRNFYALLEEFASDNLTEGNLGGIEKEKKESLNEAVNKSGVLSVCAGLSKAYGGLMLDSKAADKILAACGKEPTGKDATFDDVLAIVQDVVANAPLAVGALITILEAIFDAFMALVTIASIAIPVDGPVLDIIAALITLLPISAIASAIVAAPAAIANRLILVVRKSLRKEDVEKVETAVKEAGVEEQNEDLDDDFMDAEKMDMSEFDSHQGKLEDIEFVMTEYIADSMLIEFVKKVDATTWLVGVEDEVVTVKFDPSWSEYVYTIEGRGPYSHSSYEYISRDVYDFVMSQHTGDEYDDNFDDLSSFNECSEVKKADALYGVEERDELVEAVYTDTNGIMGIAGETYTTAELRKIWNDSHNDDPSMAKYNGDYDKWVSDTLAQMSRNDDVDEAFDMTYGPDLDKLSWQVASLLDVDALGEDNWIEFDCDEPRGLMGSKEKTMRFQAIGENAHKYGYLKTAGSKVEVHFRNGSEAVCNNAEEIARFIAGEFGISI